MEYSGKRISGNCTEEDLDKLLIEQPDKEIYKKVLENWDQIAKPLDGMGRFETLIAQIGAILGTEEIDISININNRGGSHNGGSPILRHWLLSPP